MSVQILHKCYRIDICDSFKVILWNVCTIHFYKLYKILPSTHLASTQASECLQKFPKQREGRKSAIFSQGDTRATKIPLLPHVLCVPQRTILKADHGKMLHIRKPGPLQYPTPLPSFWSSVDRVCSHSVFLFWSLP